VALDGLELRGPRGPELRGPLGAEEDALVAEVRAFRDLAEVVRARVRRRKDRHAALDDKKQRVRDLAARDDDFVDVGEQRHEDRHERSRKGPRRAVHKRQPRQQALLEVQDLVCVRECAPRRPQNAS